MERLFVCVVGQSDKMRILREDYVPSQDTLPGVLESCWYLENPDYGRGGGWPDSVRITRESEPPRGNCMG